MSQRLLTWGNDSRLRQSQRTTCAAGCKDKDALYFVSDFNDNQVRAFRATSGEACKFVSDPHQPCQTAQRRLGVQASTSVPSSR